MGRRFRSFLDQAFWWQQEAILFLQKPLQGLGLQHYGPIKEVVEASPHAVICPNPNACQPADERVHSVGIPVHLGSSGRPVQRCGAPDPSVAGQFNELTAQPGKTGLP